MRLYVYSRVHNINVLLKAVLMLKHTDMNLDHVETRVFTCKVSLDVNSEAIPFVKYQVMD
jgi:hypothetical protein